MDGFGDKCQRAFVRNGCLQALDGEGMARV